MFRPKVRFASVMRGPLSQVAAVCAALVCAAAPAAAAEVTLRLKGGGAEVKGELVSFDGTQYVINAPGYGPMQFDVARIDCVGDACGKRLAAPLPPLERLNTAVPETATIAVGAGVSAELAAALVRGYADTMAVTATRLFGGPAGETRFRLQGSEGRELATIVVRQAAGSAADMARAGVHGLLVDTRLGEEDVKALQGIEPGFDPKLHQQAIAQDGLAVIVSPGNPALALSEDQLADVLAGRAETWPDVGLPGGRIAVHALKGSDTALGRAIDAFLKPRNLSLKTGILEAATPEDVADAVTRDPDGLAVVSFASQRSAKRINIRGVCGLIHRPTTFSVKTGEYPLSRTIHLVTPGSPQLAVARGFVRYATSPRAQAAIAEALYIDTRPETVALEDQMGRIAHAIAAPSAAFDPGLLKQLLADLKGWRRLSTTLQLAELDTDARIRREMKGLADQLLAADFAGQQVLLLAYDEIGAKLTNSLQLSAKRAANMRTALLAAGSGQLDGKLVAAKGYGPIAPVHCNENAGRRVLNRRLEVWVNDR